MSSFGLLAGAIILIIFIISAIGTKKMIDEQKITDLAIRLTSYGTVLFGGHIYVRRIDDETWGIFNLHTGTLLVEYDDPEDAAEAFFHER